MSLLGRQKGILETIVNIRINASCKRFICSWDPVFVMKYYRPDGMVSPKTLGLYRDLSGGGSGGHKHLSHSG